MAAKQRPAIRASDLHTELVRYVDVTIPTASVLALNGTPYQLLAAPPAGFINIFDGARISLDYNSAAYGSLHDATIRYTNGSGQTCATLTASGFFDATSDQVRYLYPVAAAAFTPVANAKLVLFVGTGEMTTGDSPLKVRLFYHRVPTGL